MPFIIVAYINNAITGFYICLTSYFVCIIRYEKELGKMSPYYRVNLIARSFQMYLSRQFISPLLSCSHIIILTKRKQLPHLYGATASVKLPPRQ
jgi:hypothetical protein